MFTYLLTSVTLMSDHVIYSSPSVGHHCLTSNSHSSSHLSFLACSTCLPLVIASLIRLFPPIPPLAFPFFVTLSASLFLPCLPCLPFFSNSFVSLFLHYLLCLTFFSTSFVALSSFLPCLTLSSLLLLSHFLQHIPCLTLFSLPPLSAFFSQYKPAN